MSERDAQGLLFGICYSPWTERVRLALDWLDVPYRYSEHVPMITEPLVRLRARRLSGRITVPAWIPAKGNAVFNSISIVRAVDRERRLFPESEEAATGLWDSLSQGACSAFRTRIVAATAASPEAQADSLPAFVPAVARPALRLVTKSALLFFRAKYETVGDPSAPVIRALDALREGLAGGKRHLLGDSLSFADLAMATVIQGVEPVDGAHIPLAPSIREVWREPDLAARYGDLVAWRDGIYADFARPRSAHAA